MSRHCEERLGGPSYSSVTLFSLIFSLYLIGLSGSSSRDWTQQCPSKCFCRWIGGKKTVECKDAGYSSIPTGLSDEVQVIDLRGNIIPTLRNYVFRDSGLVNLHKIRMTNCGIQWVEKDAFAELKLLVELDLSENGIREWTLEAFQTNYRLREFQLTGNPLTRLLGSSFPPLMHFQKLSFRNCNLTVIPPRAFEQLTNLEQLDLSGNAFEYLPLELFSPLKNLKTIGFQDNPWRCDCRLQSLRDWAISHKLLTFPPTKCATPEHLVKLDWNQLLSSNFACSPVILTVSINGQAQDVYIVGDIGKTIRLECLSKANPPADVRWVKGGIVMNNATASASGKPYFVRISGENERWINLTLKETNIRDGGDYTCVVENSGGSDERNVTLNFEDVPSGVGVGMGIGSDGRHTGRRSWLWILIGSLIALVGIIVIISIFVCICARKKSDKNNRTVTNKGLEQGVPLVSENESKSASNEEHLMTTIKTKSEDPDYPDLLDLPRRKNEESPVGSMASTLPDRTRLIPEELSPGSLHGMDPTRQPFLFYTQPYLFNRRPHSPYSGSVASFSSERPPVIVPPPHRPGYVTLPRRPRISSWNSPASTFPRGGSGSVSPTGSTVTLGGTPYLKYDNLGARTTAAGSTGSLNRADPYAEFGRGRRPPPTPQQQLYFDPIIENEPLNDSFPPDFGLPTNISQSQSPIPTDTLPPTGKKVPPKPPPKPKPKTETVKSGDDGTEV